MSESITLPAPVIDVPARPPTKWEREYQAFRRQLPELLAAYRGRYVAIHEEQVVDSGDDKIALALRVLTRIGNTAIHIGFVSEEPAPIARSGVRRDLSAPGDAP